MEIVFVSHNRLNRQHNTLNLKIKSIRFIRLTDHHYILRQTLDLIMLEFLLLIQLCYSHRIALPAGDLPG